MINRSPAANHNVDLLSESPCFNHYTMAPSPPSAVSLISSCTINAKHVLFTHINPYEINNTLAGVNLSIQAAPVHWWNDHDISSMAHFILACCVRLTLFWISYKRHLQKNLIESSLIMATLCWLYHYKCPSPPVMSPLTQCGNPMIDTNLAALSICCQKIGNQEHRYHTPRSVRARTMVRSFFLGKEKRRWKSLQIIVSSSNNKEVTLGSLFNNMLCCFPQSVCCLDTHCQIFMASVHIATGHLQVQYWPKEWRYAWLAKDRAWLCTLGCGILAYYDDGIFAKHCGMFVDLDFYNLIGPIFSILLDQARHLQSEGPPSVDEYRQGHPDSARDHNLWERVTHFTAVVSSLTKLQFLDYLDALDGDNTRATIHAERANSTWVTHICSLLSTNFM